MQVRVQKESRYGSVLMVHPSDVFILQRTCPTPYPDHPVSPLYQSLRSLELRVPASTSGPLHMSITSLCPELPLYSRLCMAAFCPCPSLEENPRRSSAVIPGLRIAPAVAVTETGSHLPKGGHSRAAPTLAPDTSLACASVSVIFKGPEPTKISPRHQNSQSSAQVGKLRPRGR